LGPERIRSWLDEQTALANIRPPPPPAPLVIGRGEDRLIVRGLTGDGRRLLLLKERRAHLAAESLSHLGISGREAEVLAWAAAGKSDEGIARILGMSFRTVKKHLEHVYQKLGVENRTAAAAIAHEAAGRAPSTRAGA
jgi:DNA-binding CsgD family transcriptional regulator